MDVTLADPSEVRESIAHVETLLHGAINHLRLCNLPEASELIDEAGRFLFPMAGARRTVVTIEKPHGMFRTRLVRCHEHGQLTRAQGLDFAMHKAQLHLSLAHRGYGVISCAGALP